jgi:hypothetical protein
MTLKKVLFCIRSRRLTYRSSESAEPFSLGAVTWNEQNKKRSKEKLTERVDVASSWLGPCSSDDDKLDPMRRTPDCSELCKFWFSCVKAFRICGGRFRRIAIGFRTRPYNCARITAHHVTYFLLL